MAQQLKWDLYINNYQVTLNIDYVTVVIIFFSIVVYICVNGNIVAFIVIFNIYIYISVIPFL